MTKEFLKRAGGAGELADSLLPPLPPAKQCAKGTYYLPPEEHNELLFMLAELRRSSGVKLSFATFLRLAALAAKPHLAALAKQQRKLTSYEVYQAILSPPDSSTK